MLATFVFLLTKFTLAGIDLLMEVGIEFFAFVRKASAHFFSRGDLRRLRTTVETVHDRSADGAGGFTDARSNFTNLHRLQLEQVNEKVHDERNHCADYTRILHVYHVSIESAAARKCTSFDQVGHA